MSTSTLSVSIKQLLAELRSAGDDRTDEELLSRFVRSRDEDALAALVNRHASMVWGVCRRQLRNTQDAEDAFQATFLVLVRKASCVPGQAVPNWLYGVARQTAVRVLTTVAKRGNRETQVVNMPETAMRENRDDDLQIEVDAELSRLPGHYRGVVILCDLEGMTRKEAARQLGIPEGSVASRLARARALLAKRLQQRGVMFSGSVAAVLSAGAASSASPALVVSTIKAAGLLAAGQATGVVSLKVAALTEGVVKVMFVSKLKAMFSVVLVLGILGTGATFRTYQAASGQDDTKPVAEKPSEAMAEEEKEEAITAWGKEVNGLQIGVQLGKQRAYRVGENVTLILRLRNNGKAPVPYRYGDEYFLKNPPLITDASGKAVTINPMSVFGHVLLKSVAPGKEVDLVQLQLDLRPVTDRSKDTPWTICGTGKFQIQYPVTGVVGEVRPDLPGMKLVTGKLELEVKDPEKLPPEKEPFTAWGKEVGGLQAGLGLPPGAKRVYQYGETLTLLVRVRNVGKKAVKFEYIRQFLDENRPTVTDARGKVIGQSGTEMLGIHGPTEVTVEPGKETVLETRMHGASGSPYALLPESGGFSVNKALPLFVGNGKFGLQFERVIGNSSSGFLKSLDPALSKLATGKLELEVKEPEKQLPEKEPFTAWGKEIGGLQAGLGFKAGEQRVYRQGETVTLVVRVRNVGKNDMKFKYYPKFLSENSPKVLDETGKRVSLRGNTLHILKREIPKEVNLAVGKEIELYERELHLAKGNEDAGELKTRDIFPTGKFLIQHEQVIGYPLQAYSVQADKLDPTLEELATGKLELEVKEPEKLAQEKKEPFTAWGKEIGGLQAGLGFKAGEQRVYRQGETVTLVVRVRNVGKEAVKFEYVRQFLDENPPTVTDAGGENLLQSKISVFGNHGPTIVTLEPGKDIVLETRIHGASGSPYALLPEIGGTSSAKVRPLFVGSGKISLYYDAVFGNSSSGNMKLDPVLSKLATGKLELEVKEAPAEKPKVLTPEEAIKIAGDSELTKKFNATKPAVEFKVEFVTKTIQIKASGEKDAAWVHGHSPEDICLGLLVPNMPGAAIDLVKRDHIRFVATLTAKAIKQFNKAGINDLEKHFKGKTVRVAGPISRHAYDGEGSPNEVEIVLDDMSQLEVVK